MDSLPYVMLVTDHDSIEARPRYGYQDPAVYQRAQQHKWNPGHQEVIVIDDSPSPERYAHYNEPPSNNTRAANRRREPPRQANVSTRHAGANNAEYRLPMIQDWDGLYLDTSTHPYNLNPNNGPAQQNIHDCLYTPASTSTDAGHAPYPYPLNSSDGRSSYETHYNPPAPVTPVVRSGKRKRQNGDCSTYTHGMHNMRDVGLVQPLPASKAVRQRRKNKEVLLRHEPDLTPNDQRTPYDDSEGHYQIIQGSYLTPRYRVDKLLGQGTFGKVVRAFDRHTRHWVAVKVIRAVQKYRDASMVELRVLRTLQENDPNNIK